MHPVDTTLNWHGVWPTLNSGRCKRCGAHMDEGDGIYFGWIGSSMRDDPNEGLWCVDCYMLPDNDTITRCE